MIKKNKITYGILILGIWALFAANGIKDFYFEMKLKARGEVISYSTLAEFCGWTGDKKPGESDFDYSWRSARKYVFGRDDHELSLCAFFRSGIWVNYGALLSGWRI